MGKSKQTEELSKSKAKRIERHKEVSTQRRKKITSKVIWILVAVAIVGCVAFFAGKAIYEKARITTSISDFSQGLTDDGLIEGVNVSDYLTLLDLDNFVVPLSEVSATDDEIESDIESTLSSHEYSSDDTSLEVADGDKVNIDYVGTIDGEEFDGGSSEGYDLTIGSDSFIDGFEDQLIGSHPGDVVEVNVTFPEDYSSTDLAGKDAVFTVTVNGVYVTPELTDEFVSENLSDYASTADEYREYLSNKYYEEHLEDYISTHIIDDSTIISYPKEYLKTVREITKYNDEYNLSYYNSMFSQYGISGYDNLWDMRNLDDEMAYEDELRERAKESVKQALVYQAIYEKYGLTLDFDEYCAELNEENGDDTYADSLIETYGQGYMMQSKISELVLEYLEENVTVQ